MVLLSVTLELPLELVHLVRREMVVAVEPAQRHGPHFKDTDALRSTNLHPGHGAAGGCSNHLHEDYGTHHEADKVRCGARVRTYKVAGEL